MILKIVSFDLLAFIGICQPISEQVEEGKFALLEDYDLLLTHLVHVALMELFV